MEVFLTPLALWIILGTLICLPYKSFLNRRFKKAKRDLSLLTGFLADVHAGRSMKALVARFHLTLNREIGGRCEALWSLTRIVFWIGDLSIMLLYHGYMSRKSPA